MNSISRDGTKAVQVDREEYEEMATIAIAHWESQTAMIRYARELERHLDDRTIAKARDAAELRDVDRAALEQLECREAA